MAKNQTLELSILIGGHVDNSLTQAVKSANTQLSSMANGASKLAANIAKVTVGIASGITAGLVDATKEAVAFESEMLDVTKYVGGLTDANGKVKTDAYAEMSKDILDLSTQIPYTAKELTRLAAAAGQSGKSMDDLISGGFLKDVAEMGTAMDISADQAGDWAAKWEVAFNMQNSKKLFGAKTPAGMAKATSALFGSIQQAQASGGIIGLLKGSSIGQYGARVARSAKNLAGTDFIQNTVGVGRWLGQKVTGTQLGGFVGNMGQKAMGFGQGLLGGAKNIAGTAIGGVKNLAGRAASTKVGQFALNVGGGIAKGTGDAFKFLGSGLSLANTAVGPIAGKLGGAFMGLLGTFGPVITGIGGIIAVVSLLGDHFEDIRQIVGNVFGEKGLAMFDGFTSKIHDIAGNVRDSVSNA